MPPAVVAVLAGVLVGVLSLFVNVAAVRHPRPHGVVVTTAGVAPGRVQAALDRQDPGGYRVRAADDPLDVAMDVEEREAYGGLSVQASGPTVVVGGANGVRATRIVRQALTRASAAVGERAVPHVHDAVPLGRTDVRGLGLQQVLLGTVLGGFLMGVVSSELTLDEELDVRLVAFACFAILFGGLSALILDQLTGALAGDFLAIWVWVGVTAFVVSTGVAAAARLVGQAGIPVAMALFLVLGNPSSGASAPTAFLPGLFRAVGPWLPPNAEANGLLGSTYFDAGVLREALVLALWALLAVAILVVLDSTRGPRSPLAYGAAAAAADEPATAG